MHTYQADRAMNFYAHTKGSVDIGFVDVDATGNLRASGQCRFVDTVGKSGVVALCRVSRMPRPCGRGRGTILCEGTSFAREYFVRGNRAPERPPLSVRVRVRVRVCVCVSVCMFVCVYV